MTNCVSFLVLIQPYCKTNYAANNYPPSLTAVVLKLFNFGPPCVF